MVGHLTVNEDGEGSSPSAPASFALWNAPIPTSGAFGEWIRPQRVSPIAVHVKFFNKKT
jgi:hypothetical protein